ncbi:MAG: Rap1a/Tai family immunity protein [Pseudolabrys sp.]
MKLPGVMLAAASQCIALLSAALCLGGGAMAQNQPAPAASANLVMNGCRFVNSPSNYQDLFMQGRCLGVVSVLVDFSPGVCLPPGAITIQQAVRVVDARPARLHENFNKLVLEALREAWPSGGNR